MNPAFSQLLTHLSVSLPQPYFRRIKTVLVSDTPMYSRQSQYTTLAVYNDTIAQHQCYALLVIFSKLHVIALGDFTQSQVDLWWAMVIIVHSQLGNHYGFANVITWVVPAVWYRLIFLTYYSTHAVNTMYRVHFI